jgi:hypothetical protein
MEARIEDGNKHRQQRLTFEIGMLNPQTGLMLKLQKHEISPHAKGHGERGGYDLLKGRLISWLNARFFYAGLL